MIIPPLLVHNVTESWPLVGREWLARLPALIADLTVEWGLTVNRQHRMTFHWVASVTRVDGSPAVLKVGVADGHLAAEAAALRHYDGAGAVRVLVEDLSRGALLLEEARPGTPLAECAIDDAAATRVLLSAARSIHRAPPPGGGIPHLRAYRADLVSFPARGPLPPGMVARALGLFDDLCDSSPGDVVLHGDLHHENVLRGTRAPWLVIDPHGVVGDPGWEIGPLLYNPCPENRDPALLDLVPARLEMLPGDPARALAWGFVASVISEVWSVTSNGGSHTRAYDVAALLQSRLGD